MRRVATITLSCLLLMVVGGCRNDGRTLRPASPDQTESISVPIPSSTDDPTFVDPDGIDDAVTSTITLPPAAPVLLVTAPWRTGAAIDARYTCDGLNVSPALSWSAAPAGTVEIAITLSDLDAPGFAHWVIAGIPPQSIALDEATVPLDAYEATNGLDDIGYTGPCPPAGSTHRYAITVHYLDNATGLDNGTPATELIAAITSAQTASAEVTGAFSRN